MGMMDESSMNGDHNDVVKPPPLIEYHSDEELMRQIAEGRQEALGPLHARYASLIYGVAARSLDRAAAEEISQEVFLAVWRHAASFDPTRGTFRAWVLQITRRSVLNELRRRDRRPRATTQSDSSGGDHLPDPGPDPAESVWQRASPRRRAGGRAGLAPSSARGALSGLSRRPDQRASRRRSSNCRWARPRAGSGPASKLCAEAWPRWSRRA